MKIGFIGTGNMGTILIEAFLGAGAVRPEEITVTNRTLSKAYTLQERCGAISVAETAEETARRADLIFLCVKPLQFAEVIAKIKPAVTQEQCVVSITSPISVAQLESQLNCHCARFIPSITNRALSGVSLLTFGESCSREWQEKISDLAKSISAPVSIPNEITRAASDIVSCGPAFFSFLARAFIDGACQATKIDEATATILTQNMLAGLGELLSQEIYSLPALQEKVCVKGGITGEGIKVLEGAIGDMFPRLFEATQAKFEEDLEQIEEDLGHKY
ncbi:late competence protein ComER [Actinomycetes bacterium NPDC127524]